MIAQSAFMPVGFKQTEVGVIPEDWGVEPLGALTLRMTNGFVGPAIRHYTGNGDGVLYIQGYNVEENSFNFHGIKYVTHEFHRANAKSCLRPGDMLTVQTGEVGLTTVVPENLAGSNCHALIISRFDKAKVESRFMSYYLNSKPGRARLRLIETGTTMKHLNVGDMLHFLVPLPPTLAEQEAIAGALGDADVWIESLERLVAKKRSLKQAAMQQLFTGKRRLPGFEEKWTPKRLGEFGFFLKGNGVKRDDAQSGSIPCIRYGEIYTRHNDYVRRFYSRISHEVACTATPLKKGDVLFAGSGETREEIGKCVAFVDECEAYAGGDIVILRAGGIDPVFMGYYLNSAHVNAQKASGGQGDAVVHISAHALGDVECTVPCVCEQAAIANVITDMDSEIAAIEAKLAKARQIKQGMMHELLTGKTRLV